MSRVICFFLSVCDFRLAVASWVLRIEGCLFICGEVVVLQAVCQRMFRFV